MAGAYINIDNEGDQISLNVVYVGGFDVANNAHQTANFLTKYLDSVAQRVGDAVVVPMPELDEEGFPVIETVPSPHSESELEIAGS